MKTVKLEFAGSSWDTDSWDMQPCFACISYSQIKWLSCDGPLGIAPAWLLELPAFTFKR